MEAAQQGGANDSHKSDPKFDTADFNDDPRPGNIRVDYTLFNASTTTVSDAAVFWPASSDPLSRLTGEYPFPTSDHRLVWADVTLAGATNAGGSESDPENDGRPDDGDASDDGEPSRPDLPNTGW